MDRYERAFLRHGVCWFFLILCSYYIMRPIREQIGSKYGSDNLSNLFWVTFIVNLIAIPLFSWLVGKYDRRKLVPMVYAVFVGSLLLIWAAMRWLPENWQLRVAQTFFVWVTVFGLFIVSFFWSVAGDLLSSKQGKRIFGVVMGGGTVGGLIGSQMAALLVSRIGVANLLLVPVVLVVGALGVYFLTERACRQSASATASPVSGKATGGNPFAGFTAVFESQYLLAIFIFVLLMALCSTTVYFQQAEIVRGAYALAEFDESEIVPRAASIAEAAERSQLPEDLMKARGQLQEEASDNARTAYFAQVNFCVSILTLIAQFFLASRLMRTIGLGWTLAVLPMVYVVGLVLLSASPTLLVLAVVSTIGRAAEYGICNPAREVLYTIVDREDRYKAKSFIDTVVRRGGDSTSGSVFRGLRHSQGFELPHISWVAIPFAIAWAVLSIWIGKENVRIAENEAADQETAA